MKQDMSEFESDDMVTDTQIKVISKLIKKQVELETLVDKCEEDFKNAKMMLRKVQENDLVDALLAAGVSEFKTDDGLGVKIKEDLKASIPAKNKDAAIRWLMDNDLSSLVKEDVIVPFDKGETEKVNRLIGILEHNGITDFTTKPALHTNQVKAALKELMDKGVDVPADTFGLYFFKQAIVSR